MKPPNKSIKLTTSTSLIQHENTTPSMVQGDAFANVDTDFLCDKTVQFMESGEVRNIVAVELAEQSIYFERLLCHHKGNGIIWLPEFLNSEFNSISEFIRTGKTIINLQNVYQLFISSDFLLMNNLKTQCIDFVKEVINDPSTAIKLWINCRETFWPEFKNMAYENILKYFEVGCKTEEFLALEYEDIKTILSDDGLNCTNEYLLVDVITEWIKVYPDNRQRYVDELGILIRFGLLGPAELDIVKQSSLLKMSIKLKDILEKWPNCLIDENNELLTTQRHQLVTPRIPNKAVLVLGGWCDEEGPKAAAQIYDPQANQWTIWSEQVSDVDAPITTSSNAPSLGNIPRRVYAGCVLVDNKVYLVGGFDGNTALKSTLCYDFEADSGWYEISCMYDKRYYVCVAHADGFIYALGGHNGENQGRLASAERFNIAENLWHPIASMSRVRSDAGAAELLGKIYVCGGFEGRMYHSSAECYNADANQWTLINRMICARGGVTLAQHGNFIYAMGGNDGTNRLRSIERYDPVLGRWEIVGNMNRRKSNLSSTIINDDIYIIGGWSDEPEPRILDLVEKFNVKHRQSTIVQALCFPASATCSCTLTNKNIVTKYIKRRFDPECIIAQLVTPVAGTPSTLASADSMPDLVNIIEETSNESQPETEQPPNSNANETVRRRSQRRRRMSQSPSSRETSNQPPPDPAIRRRRRTLDRG